MTAARTTKGVQSERVRTTGVALGSATGGTGTGDAEIDETKQRATRAIMPAMSSLKAMVNDLQW